MFLVSIWYILKQLFTAVGENDGFVTRRFAAR